VANSVQYRDVGLVIDVTPVITNEGYVEVKMKLESTSVVPGSDELNRPRFTQRTLATVSRIQDGKTAIRRR
jgi:type II secretory pathway component GspD/PulD (secretin)